MPMHVPDGIVQNLGRFRVRGQRMRAWRGWLKSSHALPLNLTRGNGPPIRPCPPKAELACICQESGIRHRYPPQPQLKRKSSFQRGTLPVLSLVIRAAVTLLTQPFPCSRQYKIRTRVLCQFRQSVPSEQLINGGCRYRPAGTFFKFGL